MAIVGAILGDISGSQYEFKRPDNLDWKHCDLFTHNCFFTDDTIMTVATKQAILDGRNFADVYREFGNKYPDADYGQMFWNWLFVGGDPYNSFGNGSAMRCSFIGEHFNTEKEVIDNAFDSAKCTHNHLEGLKGAMVTAMCVFMARTGASKREILEYTKKHYPRSGYVYGVDRPLSEYRDCYKWDVTCQGSVPVAIRCFLESEDYETFLRNVYSLKCDMDTLCAIGGGIAEEFYKGVGFDAQKILGWYLDNFLYDLVFDEKGK